MPAACVIVAAAVSVPEVSEIVPVRAVDAQFAATL